MRAPILPSPWISAVEWLNNVIPNCLQLWLRRLGSFLPSHLQLVLFNCICPVVNQWPSNFALLWLPPRSQLHTHWGPKPWPQSHAHRGLRLSSSVRSPQASQLASNQPSLFPMTCEFWMTNNCLQRLVHSRSSFVIIISIKKVSVFQKKLLGSVTCPSQLGFYDYDFFKKGGGGLGWENLENSFEK